MFKEEGIGRKNQEEINIKKYPSFEDKYEAETHISNILESKTLKEIKEIETDWDIEYISKEKIDNFKEAYQDIKDHILKDSDKSEKFSAYALNTFSLGIIMGSIAGFVSGDVAEGIRKGGMIGLATSTVIHSYSAYQNVRNIKYNEKMDEIYKKFVDEPINKLYGIKK